MGKRSELTVAQRREEPAIQLARRWGVSEQTLHRWREEFVAGGEAALGGGKNGSDP